MACPPFKANHSKTNGVIRAFHGAGCERAQKIALLDLGVPVNPSVAHAELIATFKRAQADAAHKFGLIKTAAQKGPKAVQAAAETAAKAKTQGLVCKETGYPGGEPQGLSAAQRIARYQSLATTPNWSKAIFCSARLIAG